MYYLVTIGYETEQQDRNGNFRLEKVKYIFEGESAEEVVIITAKYCEGDTRSYEILSIAKQPIECIISPHTTPQYYKQ